MDDLHQHLYDQIGAIMPFDDVEAEHQADVLAWLHQTTDIYRREAPATPAKHLVSYIVTYDPEAQTLLLGEHIKSGGLMLPPGGHVEPGETPWQTVLREADEELQLVARPYERVGQEPLFVTVTPTRGLNSHVDVSLWFVIVATAADISWWDRNEFRQISWYNFAAIAQAQSSTLDPHMQRFCRKLQTRIT